MHRNTERSADFAGTNTDKDAQKQIERIEKDLLTYCFSVQMSLHLSILVQVILLAYTGYLNLDMQRAALGISLNSKTFQTYQAAEGG